MSSFVGLYTGLTGLRAAQTGIDVTSHNVANANTSGYTRQRVELAARPPYRSPIGLLGTGVDVLAIARLRDGFLDDRFRTAVAQHAAAGARAEFLTTLESLTGEPDHGLSVRIGRLWGAAEAWANDPADAATRRQVLTELGAIAEGFRSTSAAWSQLGADTAGRRDTVVDTVNSTLRTLDDLNRKLTNADPSRVGPDLLDQRDLLLDQLAQLTGSSARLEADGSVSVTLGGIALLGPDGPSQLRVGADGGSIEVVSPAATSGTTITTDVTAAVSGELGGMHRVLTVDLPRWQAELDALAGGLANAVNTINTGGVRADGSTGVPLLVFDGPATSAGLRLADVTIDDLAAATAGAPPAAHDGSNARLLADLRSTPITYGGTTKTIEARLADLVVGLAGDVRSSLLDADAARGVATGARLARAAQHGVSLDEEMVNLVRYQRALEAAARVMTTVDEALETLVNRVGIVGR